MAFFAVLREDLLCFTETTCHLIVTFMTEDEDAIWKALADPTRRQLLDMLATRPCKTGELCAHFETSPGGGLSRTGVMKHLDILETAGVVLVRRAGRVRWNHLNPVPIQRVCDRWVSQHVCGFALTLGRLKDRIESAALDDDSPGGSSPGSESPGSDSLNSNSPNRTINNRSKP